MASLRALLATNVLPELVTLLEGMPDEEVRQQLLLTLFEWKEPKSIPSLRRELDRASTSLPHRMMAARALDAMGQDVSPWLQGLAKAYLKAPGESCQDLGLVLQTMFQVRMPRTTIWLVRARSLKACASEQETLLIAALQGASSPAARTWVRAMTQSTSRRVRIAAHRVLEALP